MPSKHFGYFLLVLFSASLLVGCQSLPPPTASPTTASPSPTVLTAKKTLVTSNELGAVQATLVDATSGKPLADQVFYLAKMLPVGGVTTTAYVAVLDRTTSPGDISDAQGNLVFSSVPPGKYAVALEGPLRQSLPKDAKSEAELVVDVVAGQVVDLGKHAVFLDKAATQ